MAPIVAIAPIKSILSLVYICKINSRRVPMGKGKLKD
jgi:hypothetical protein